MSIPILKPAFIMGEVSPALFGRFDLSRLGAAASTQRNMWSSYHGGAYSRAGTAFVGFSKQTGRSYPPRLITFQFSINQGLALEFGNYYMRVVSNGSFVTESPFVITGISQSNPAVVTYSSVSSGVSVTANIGGVTASYARGDLIVPAGGTPVTSAQMLVQSTTLAALSLNAGGSGYAVGDTITLAGGIATLAPVLTVLTLSGSAIATFAISNGGVFTTNSTTFTQASTSGTGSGATFNVAIFGPKMMSFFNAGEYTAVPANPANQGSTTGSGLGATYTIVWSTPSALANGDWVFLSQVGGMTQVDGETYVIAALTGTTFALTDVYGANIDSTSFNAYTSGGFAARIFTLVTPYAEADLEYLKFTQSADVMSICCLNQQTATEYQPQDLTRFSDTDWQFLPVVSAPTVKPPASASGSTSSSGSVDYNYVVTSVSPVDGSESIASPVADIASAVNIAATAGNITITWAAVNGVNEYNIYKATPTIGASVPVGAFFGWAGSAYGTQFVDSNIVADMSQVPPTHQDPFARGQILAANVTAGGSSASFTITINSVTGSGAVLLPVVVGSALVAIIVQEPGQNYQPSDTLSIDHSATATLVIGPESGTFPSTVAYFQERRAYANSLNDPDTYWFSQPGSFTNFDFRIPTIDSDSITGSPWSVEVNGIQFMVPMPGGLVVLTGLQAWQLTGTGGSSLNPQPITPSTQQAQPQAYNGCSPTVPPIRIDYDIVYVQAKGSIVRDLSYQFYTNIYTGTDITLNSSQLFTGFTIREWAWCEEPYKIMWAVRNDGTMLSLTYLKPEQIAGWARHDTHGRFQSVCSVTEPPTDALYTAVLRFPGAHTAYMIERMDNRIWATVEDCWCVDCGLTLPQPEPDATLSASSATGLGAVTGVTNEINGTGYSSGTTAIVVDDNGQGPGTGAVPTVTVGAGGTLTITFAPGNEGSGYIYPAIVVSDPANAGSGYSSTPILDNSANFSVDAPVFSVGNIGSYIRAGNGIAVITAFTDSQHVVANILSPLVTAICPNSGSYVQPQPSGSWTLTAPVSTISGLNYLAGATVTGLADGNIITPRQVSAQGTITLDTPASAVTVGLGFQAQLQSTYIEAGEPTVQGQRKKICDVVARIEASRGIKVGTNQVDGSTLSPPQIEVEWNDLSIVPDDGPNFPLKPYNALATPLRTGDTQKIPVFGGFAMPGQVCLQQDNPLPMQVLALISGVLPGDLPQSQVPKKPGRGRGEQ